MALNYIFDIYYMTDRQLIEACGDLGRGIAITMTNKLSVLAHIKFSSILLVLWQRIKYSLGYRIVYHDITSAFI